MSSAETNTFCYIFSRCGGAETCWKSENLRPETKEAAEIAWHEMSILEQELLGISGCIRECKTDMYRRFLTVNVDRICISYPGCLFSPLLLGATMHP